MTRSVIHRSIATFVLLTGAIALTGCQPKSEQAQETPPPATESVTTGAPMTFNWDAQSNCLKYNPATVSAKSGSAVNFSTSTADTVWVTAPAGCFSPAETTFAVVRGQNDANPTASTPGSYNLTIRPTVCSATTGGPGPSVIVDSGAN
jgi:plastocyanin